MDLREALVLALWFGRAKVVLVGAPGLDLLARARDSRNFAS
jgi:hypothetical protein